MADGDTVTHVQRHGPPGPERRECTGGALRSRGACSAQRRWAVHTAGSCFLNFLPQAGGGRVTAWPAEKAWQRRASHGCSHNTAAVTGHPRGCSPEMLLVTTSVSRRGCDRGAGVPGVSGVCLPGSLGGDVGVAFR